MRSSSSSTSDSNLGFARSLFVLAAFVLALLPSEARAFSWMVRHGYTNCAQCHVDPSGGGLLTEYGRAQGEILLRTVYQERGSDWEPGEVKDFLWGVVPLPDWLQLGGASRSSVLGSGGTGRFIQMQADLRGAVEVEGIVGYGSIALAEEGAQGALITTAPNMNVVSREHWVGYEATRSLLVRAGRMPIPFGIRIDEHTQFVREITDTDINDGQQHGVAAAYNKPNWRTEVMGIVGNLQLSPDPFRERGGAGFFEWMPDSNLAVGMSGLYGTRELDPVLFVERTRQAYGIMGRYSPITPVAIAVEANALLEDRADESLTGHTGLVQLDYMPIQGVHVEATGEWYTLGDDEATGAWLGAVWYFAPHMDLRVDVLKRWGFGATEMGLAQLHFYL